MIKGTPKAILVTGAAVFLGMLAFEYAEKNKLFGGIL
jgi:hypothetical protein